jgi:hypothetical protein
MQRFQGEIFNTPLLCGGDALLFIAFFPLNWYYDFMDDIYEGETAKGKPHGKGKMTESNGNVYEGDFANGEWHGKGKVTYRNGDVYEGDWNDGYKHGKGKFTFENGDIYEGNFVEGDFNGKGKYTYWHYVKDAKFRRMYEGDFFDGKFHGKGKLTYEDGTIEEGNWNHGEFVGK